MLRRSSLRLLLQYLQAYNRLPIRLLQRLLRVARSPWLPRMAPPLVSLLPVNLARLLPFRHSPSLTVSRR